MNEFELFNPYGLLWMVHVISIHRPVSVHAFKTSGEAKKFINEIKLSHLN